MFQTEHTFTLPLGYVDAEGALHRQGVMRLATAADEILPLQDPRVMKNPAYLLIILLSRVVVKLGNVKLINPSVIEALFTADLNYLQDLYNQINGQPFDQVQVSCPECDHIFEVQRPTAGES